MLNQSLTSIHSYFYQDHDISGVSDFIKGTNTSYINPDDVSMHSTGLLAANTKHSQASNVAKNTAKNITKKHR